MRPGPVKPENGQPETEIDNVAKQFYEVDDEQNQNLPPAKTVDSLSKQLENYNTVGNGNRPTRNSNNLSHDSKQFSSAGSRVGSRVESRHLENRIGDLTNKNDTYVDIANTHPVELPGMLEKSLVAHKSYDVIRKNTNIQHNYSPYASRSKLNHTESKNLAKSFKPINRPITDLKYQIGQV